MEQNIKTNIELELERAKLSNYILKKENEILLGTIGMMSREKNELIKQVDKLTTSKLYKLKRKIIRIIRRGR